MTSSSQRALEAVLKKIADLKATIVQDHFNLADTDIESIGMKIQQLSDIVKEKYEHRG